MYLQDFVSLKIGHAKTLKLIISELSFWRCELLKNYGRFNRMKKKPGIKNCQEKAKRSKITNKSIWKRLEQMLLSEHREEQEKWCGLMLLQGLFQQVLDTNEDKLSVKGQFC